MAVGETMLTVVGNVMSELTHRTVGNGHEVVSFWMRSNERRYDKEKAEWVDGRYFSVKVTCWRKLATSAQASLVKGDPVIVAGRLQTNDYETADGQQRSIPELEAVAIGPNLNWCTATVQRSRRGVESAPWRQPGYGEAPRENAMAGEAQSISAA